jgi:hypothetical protein
MSNNFKNIVLGLLALVVLGLLGAFVSASTNTSGGEVGRYIAIPKNDPDNFDWRILDTKTGRVYWYNSSGNLVYVDWVKGAKPSDF